MRGLAWHHAFENEGMKIAVDHVHGFLGFPLHYSIINAVNILKCAGAGTIFRARINAGKDFREGGFLKDGYSARTTVDGVAADRSERTFGIMKTEEPQS